MLQCSAILEKINVFSVHNYFSIVSNISYIFTFMFYRFLMIRVRQAIYIKYPVADSQHKIK